MLVKNIALVCLTKKISASALAQTAAALQKQATRDLSPIWDISATVDSFPNLRSVPLGYWPIIVSEDIRDPSAAGFHTDKHHQPYALVEFDATWQLTCSHELIEMLVDPYGNRMAAAGSPDPSQGKVNFLVEACDPCEDASFAYSINGILVSDFYTPNYFDPQAVSGVRYSYTGAITKPVEVLKNGYISWRDPVSRNWYQATFFGESLQIRPVEGMLAKGESLRAQMDRLTRNPNAGSRFKETSAKHKPIQEKITLSGQSRSGEWAEDVVAHLSDTSDSRVLHTFTGSAKDHSASLTVQFNSGVGSLTAFLHRTNGSSSTLTFGSTGGTQSFSNVFPDDSIVIQSVAAVDGLLTIDRDTDPATPYKLVGKTNDILAIV